MPSIILTLDDEYIRRNLKYALPPDGHDNGVSAKSWTVIAELDEHEVPLVLSHLAEAGIGAYAAGVTHMAHGATSQRRLYVDAMQYNQALEALMLVIRGQQSRDLVGYVPRKRVARTEPEQAVPATRRRTVVGIARRTAQCVLGAAVFAVLVAAGYQSYVNHFHKHEDQRPPGMHQPIAPTPP